MSLIDFHSHILPGIDDGSRDAEMTRAMLEEAARQEVKIMAATPHFYGDSDTVARFLKRRGEAMEEARPLAAEAGIRLIAGAEVAYFDGMSRAEELALLTLGRTKLLLLEMPFRQWSERDVTEVKRLLAGGFVIMLAHLERYLDFQKEKASLKEILSLPLEVQLNAECLTGFWERREPLRLIKSGRARFLGSDCHNTTSRPMNLAAGRAVIKKKLGEETLRQMDQAGMALLGIRE